MSLQDSLQAPCRCRGRGLLRIKYQTGEPDDIALCTCREGHWWRFTGAPIVRVHLQLAPEQRVAWLEDFEDEPVGALDYRAAGAVRKPKGGKL